MKIPVYSVKAHLWCNGKWWKTDIFEADWLRLAYFFCPTLWLSAFFCLLEFSWLILRFLTLSLFFLTWVKGLRAEEVSSVQTVEPPAPWGKLWFWATQIRNCLLALPFYFHIEQTSIRVKIECLLCTVAFPQSCDGIYVNHHEALQAVSKWSFSTWAFLLLMRSLPSALSFLSPCPVLIIFSPRFCSSTCAKSRWAALQSSEPNGLPDHMEFFQRYRTPTWFYQHLDCSCFSDSDCLKWCNLKFRKIWVCQAIEALKNNFLNLQTKI